MPIRIKGQDRPSQVNVAPTENRTMYHVRGAANVYEPSRTTDFEFYVPDFEGLVDFEDPSHIFENPQEVVRFSVVKCPIPHYKISEIEVKRGNSTQYFAGTPEFESGTLECNDFIGAESQSIFTSWLALASNIETGKTGISTDYKKDCMLVEYSPDGQKIREWTMYGCWVTGISESDFDHENMDKRRITATIRYDYAVPRTANL